MARKQKKKQILTDITVEGLSPEGYATGSHNDFRLHIWNALPGETVDLEVTKKKRGKREGTAGNIRNRSPLRTEPSCDHYLSCSPFQILDYGEENRLKRETGRDLFRNIAGEPVLSGAEIFYPDDPFGYRNKMEYSFFWQEGGDISFGFYRRGTKYRVPVQPCYLADPAINRAAEHVLAWLNTHRPPLRSLKSLMLRSSGEGKVLAALFAREEIPFSDYPQLTDELAGFKIYYSDPRSPASRPDRLLYSYGAEDLVDMVLGTTLLYGINSFFQVNMPQFGRALDKIGDALDPGDDIIDFYSGVGAISLPLAGTYRQAKLVDISEDCIGYAKRNMAAAGVEGCTARAVPAEDMTDIITGKETVILDPPRVGVHDKVIKRLLDVRPGRVIYLSCNPKSQAQNVTELLEGYTVTSLDFYNFFPRTPHLESLCILDRKP